MKVLGVLFLLVFTFQPCLLFAGDQGADAKSAGKKVYPTPIGGRGDSELIQEQQEDSIYSSLPGNAPVPTSEAEFEAEEQDQP